MSAQKENEKVVSALSPPTAAAVAVASTVTVVNGRIVPVASIPVVVVDDDDTTDTKHVTVVTRVKKEPAASDDDDDSDYDGRKAKDSDEDSATESDSGLHKPAPFTMLDFAEFTAPRKDMTPAQYEEYNRVRHRFDKDWAATLFSGYTKVKPTDSAATTRHKQDILDVRASIVRGSIAIIDTEEKRLALVQRARDVNDFLRQYRNTPPPVRISSPKKKRKAVTAPVSAKESAPKKAAAAVSSVSSSSSVKDAPAPKKATATTSSTKKKEKSKVDTPVLAAASKCFLDEHVLPYQKTCTKAWLDAMEVSKCVKTGSKSIQECVVSLVEAQIRHHDRLALHIPRRVIKSIRCRRSASAS